MRNDQSSDDKKPVLVLNRSIVNSLDPFHQAVALVLEKRGKILVIEDTKPGGTPCR